MTRPILYLLAPLLLAGCGANTTPTPTLAPPPAAVVAVNPTPSISVSPITVSAPAPPLLIPTVAPVVRQKSTFSRASDEELIQSVVHGLGTLILQADTTSKVTGIADVLSAMKVGAAIARPDSIDPKQWPRLARNMMFQAALSTLQKATVAQARRANGASPLDAQYNIAASLVDQAELMVRPPSSASRDSESQDTMRESAQDMRRIMGR